MIRLNLLVKTCTRHPAREKSLRHFTFRTTGKYSKQCKRCCQVAAERMAEYTSKNGADVRVKARDRIRSLRNNILNYYGGKCACCGEPRKELLALDHINGGGAEHRKEIGDSGTAILWWIRSNNYPPIFQVLCHNCNYAKGKHGLPCPHIQERTLHPIDRMVRSFTLAGTVN
jgi:hypothetical protein